MSTLVENVAKVKSAHAALSAAIEAKGVSVPAGTKLTGMPALVDQIETGGGGGSEQIDGRLTFENVGSPSIVVVKTIYFDITTMTNFDSCFSNCHGLSSLTLPDGFGKAGLKFDNCFHGCRKLKSLTLPDGFGQVAKSLNRCFSDCYVLSSLTLPDGCGQAATDIYDCFYNCQDLKYLHLPTGFGQAVTGIYQNVGFQYCKSLTDITGNPNFRFSLNLSDSTKLTHDSLMVIINGLQTVTETQTLRLGSENLAKLTEADKKIATDKGWTLA